MNQNRLLSSAAIIITPLHEPSIQHIYSTNQKTCFQFKHYFYCLVRTKQFKLYKIYPFSKPPLATLLFWTKVSNTTSNWSYFTVFRKCPVICGSCRRSSSPCRRSEGLRRAHVASTSTTAAPSRPSTRSRPPRARTPSAGAPWSCRPSRASSRPSSRPSANSTAACARRAGPASNRDVRTATTTASWETEGWAGRTGWWRRTRTTRRTTAGTTCTSAERGADVGTLRWRSRDPCPWTSDAAAGEEACDGGLWQKSLRRRMKNEPMTDISSKSFSTANCPGTQTQLIVYNNNTDGGCCVLSILFFVKYVVLQCSYILLKYKFFF